MYPRRRLFFCTLILCAFASLAQAGKPEPFVFVPSKGEGPYPVALWLHGYRGYSSSGYFPGESAEAMQKHADALGAVIVGFPATADLGDDTQQWSEEPVADHAYIQERLKTLKTSAKLDLTRVGLFGFSQGAMVAADLATLYPDSYLGAILMSPGGMGNPKASESKSAEHAKQVYYCFCGAQEHQGNVLLTRAYADHLEKSLGAKVTLKMYEGVSKHTRPADFMEKFPEWMGAILKARG
ncbi:MAG TPA: alpha/beta hydrolase-fold protein [Candidatus Saccharimonadia bacterium]|nr:alpha/beta hydrolase-fold protein [Candidatus Saccharimonadia bacterium]